MAERLAVGQTAPDFQRPGVDRGEFAMFDLHRPVEHGDAVVLVFFPTDFLELPTTVLVEMGRRGWTTRGGLTVWALSGDSIFAHHAYARRYDLDVALLSDFHAGVARSYGLAIDDWEGHGPTPTWGWVLVEDWVVRHVWSADPTPDWVVPPADSLVDAVREHANLSLDPLELAGA